MLLTAVVVVEEGITYQEDVCRCLPLQLFASYIWDKANF